MSCNFRGDDNRPGDECQCRTSEQNAKCADKMILLPSSILFVIFNRRNLNGTCYAFVLVSKNRFFFDLTERSEWWCVCLAACHWCGMASFFFFCLFFGHTIFFSFFKPYHFLFLSFRFFLLLVSLLLLV